MRIIKGIKYITNSRNIISNVANELRSIRLNSRQCHQSSNNDENLTKESTTPKSKVLSNGKWNFSMGPGLTDFISTSSTTKLETTPGTHPYLLNYHGPEQKVYFEVYGCQMNVNDAEIIWAILQKNNYKRTMTEEDADIILMVTCAIRDSAEQKIFNRLQVLNSIKKKRRIFTNKLPLKIGVLGCMAERLKTTILEKYKMVDIVAGPDAYRDLPRLLSVVEDDTTAINVQLSFDETYADITPIRLKPNSLSAYVSIMRGCNNMCTYCIVPFVRGRERSRPVSSILEEVKQLSDQGIKEVILLGQNVNSYCDTSETKFSVGNKSSTKMAKGFQTVYKNTIGGMRFSDLLDKVSLIDPEMRIRFTSPHPKDFPDEVLHLIATRPNICKQIHLPAQSGNSEVLQQMRRGYTREAYLELVDHIRHIIPDIKLSSDFIVGFCGETTNQFEDTISLMESVHYHKAFMFAYSMREKTTAHRRYTDDIPLETKNERLQALINLHHNQAENLNRMQIGTQQLVLIEGISRRSSEVMQGRTDGNTRVLIPKSSIPISNKSNTSDEIKSGNYIVAQIYSSNSNSLTGIPLYHSSIANYSNNINNNNDSNNNNNNTIDTFNKKCQDVV